MSARAKRQAPGHLPPSVATVVPDAIHAVGGGVPSSVPISWIPPAGAGWMPVQCFVLRSGRSAMVLDCGLGAHTAQLAAGLDAVLAGADIPQLLVSRWEPDAMANLPWLIRTFGIAQVLSYGGINPLDFFEGFEAASARSLAEGVAGPAQLVPLSVGQVLAVGSLRIEVLATSLRLLLTNWFYEATTRSLFTADSFGFLANTANPYPFVARPSKAQLTRQILCDSLMTKFDWLAGAHCGALIADLQAIQSRYAIDRVCPTFGGIIEGREAVSHMMKSAVSALKELSGKSRTNALAGFDWQRALSPGASVDLHDPGRIPTASN